MDDEEGRLNLEPDLASLEDGTLVDVVTTIQMRFPGCGCGKTLLQQQSFFTDCSLPTTTGKVTLFRVKKAVINGQLWLCNTDQTAVCKHVPWNDRSAMQIIETCAGIGAVDVGYEQCGATVQIANDQNIRYCQVLHAKGRTVITGDIVLPSTVAKMSKHAGCTISAGVSCQPFSLLGDQRHGKDSRAMSLVGVLQAIHLLQAPLGLLECTKAAFTSKWFQGILSQFQKQTGMVLHQNILELHECWPSRRTRWWGTLSDPCMGIKPIPSLPKTAFEPSLRHLFSCTKPLMPEEADALMLDLYELRNFHECPKGIQQNTINWDKPLPTAVHSWGSQLQQCACGCRDKGFSTERLSSKGLYGQLIPMEGSQQWMQYRLQNMNTCTPKK